MLLNDGLVWLNRDVAGGWRSRRRLVDKSTENRETTLVTRAHTRATVTWGEGFTAPPPEIWGDSIFVMLPYLTLTVTGADALLAWMRAWSVALRYADRVWPGGPTGSEVPGPAEDANRLTVALRITSEIGAPEIGARTAASDPTERGNLAVTLDPLRVTFLHGAAWESAWATWTATYEAGVRLWKLPALDEAMGSAMRWHRHQVSSKRLGLL